MNYFENCTTIEQLKIQWKNLAKTNHPDAGGDVRVMQEVNRQYKDKKKALLRPAKAQAAPISEEAEPAESYWKKNNVNPFTAEDIGREILKRYAAQEAFREGLRRQRVQEQELRNKEILLKLREQELQRVQEQELRNKKILASFKAATEKADKSTLSYIEKLYNRFRGK